MKTRILILAVIISFNTHCQPDQNEKYLKDFRKHFDILNKHKNWYVTVGDEYDGETILYAKTFNSDTLLSLSLTKHTEGNVEHFEMNEVKKIFNRDRDLVDLQSYDQKMHLRYWYRFDKKTEEKKIFVVGKYNYLYLHGGLSEQQDLYFENHADSLTRVRGDSLPPLPSNR